MVTRQAWLDLDNPNTIFYLVKNPETNNIMEHKVICDNDRVRERILKYSISIEDWIAQDWIEVMFDDPLKTDIRSVDYAGYN